MPCRPMFTLAVLIAIAIPAAADETAPAFEGYWADRPRICLRAGQVGEDTPTWIGRDGIFAHEWSCDIEDLTENLPGRAWSVILNCLDAGEVLSMREVWVLDDADQLMIVSDLGQMTRLHRCNSPKA